MKMSRFFLCLLAAGVLASCNQPKIKVYQIPSMMSDARADIPLIPQEQANEGILDGVTWKLPSQWQMVDPGSMVRAKMQTETDNGLVVISVSSFPGDVGGLLANVNRWRQQLRLAPIQDEQLPKFVSRFSEGIHPFQLVRLHNPSIQQKMYIGVVEFNEHTWFFKMQGIDQAVNATEQVFQHFLRSVAFES